MKYTSNLHNFLNCALIFVNYCEYVNKLSIVWIDETKYISQHHELKAEDNEPVQKHLSIESQVQFVEKFLPNSIYVK
uniref:Uncharacterized protein n=1 Tax=Trichobilharzia regenti TaxID=157069 RepID=A0AA85JBV5_TRIRE|nr:unnamed protein product [Trichobilharzia regenti]